MYAHTQVSNFIDVILAKLNDVDGVYTSRAEILSYLHEGIDVINSFTFFQREKVATTLAPNSRYLELLNDSALNPTNVLGYNKTVANLINEIKYHLLENDLSTATINKEVFDSTQFLALIQNKVDEFLIKTHLIYNKSSLNPAPFPINSYAFGNDILELVRLGFKITTTGKYLRIRRENEENIKAFLGAAAIDNGYPRFYSELISEYNTVNFYPNIDINGTLETIHIEHTNLVESDNLPIPSNLAFVIKYGVLAELFMQNGNGYDAKRADYCTKRWEQGIELGKNYFSILGIKINGIPASITDINELDKYDSNWENKSSSKCKNIAVLAWNLLAFDRKVNDILGLEFDLLSNSILSVSEVDFIQLPIEYIQYLYDYVLHVVELKTGDMIFYAGVDKLNSTLKMFVEANNHLEMPSNLFGVISNKNLRYRKENTLAV